MTDTIRIDNVRGIRATAKALLVAIDTGGGAAQEVRIPQSVIDADSEVWEAEQEGTLVVAAWFAEREGLV